MPPNKKNGPPKQPLEQKPSSNSEPGFPAIQKDVGSTKTKYEEEQDDEIVALQSIFGEDFQRVDIEGAGVWKKRQPCFKIHIRSEDELFSVVLQVQMTATYPKSIPLLSISQDEYLREKTRRKIKHIIETKPQELVTAATPMVYDIVDLIRNALDEAVDADATVLPSLEAERAVRESEAAEVARAAEAQEQKRKKLEDMESRRVLDDMVQNAVNKRAKENEGKRRDRRSSLSEGNSTESSQKVLSQRVDFDDRIKLTDPNNNTILFQSVTSKYQIRRGPVATISTVRPIVIGSDIIPILVLKQTNLKNFTSDLVLKQQMHDLENDLKKIKKIRHRSVLELYDFKIDKTGDEGETSGSAQSKNPSWTVSILVEYGNKGSLEEILEVAGDLPVSRARAWTIDLLDGLRFLHHSGIVHGDIHASNVLLVRNQFGEITAKLADGGYQRQLHTLGDRKNGSPNVLSVAKSAYWHAPENIRTEHAIYSFKTDVWDFGVVFLNMIFGMGIVKQYTSPTNLADSMDLSATLYEFVQKIFRSDPQKRPRASELSFCEFLATDAAVMASPADISRSSANSVNLNTPSRPRYNSISNNNHGTLIASRYKEDFVEESRLGKGGYGEVMKVRKKLDGQFYAVKKIVQKQASATLTEILKEVRLLSLLSHPYVVRYYNTWTEEIGHDMDNENAISSGEESEGESSDDGDSEVASSSDEGSGDASPRAHTGDLDYMSSHIKFEYDTEGDSSDEEAGEADKADKDDEDDESDEDGNSSTNGLDDQAPRELPIRQSRTTSRIRRLTRTILYIQMEFCARRTLANLIKDEIYRDKEQMWRIFRQILEALVYIHGMNVVHRDLKPENVFMDSSENIRIGDFGLATSGQFSTGDKNSSSSIYRNQADMTQSVGTAAYVAPEVRSSAGGVYSAKVDMYSLGIIFFEMCYPPIQGMERVQKITLLRQEDPKLPADFNMTQDKIEADIVLSLVRHNPKERPSASELLRGGKLPEPMAEETMRQTVAKLSDSDSNIYNQIVNALFSVPEKPAKDFAWDMTSANQPQANELLIQGIIKQQLTSIFRHHGALESRRALLFPRSRIYTEDPVQVLDPAGLVLQLPYDLFVPNARALAKQTPSVLRSFTFGDIYRRAGHVGEQPRTIRVVDFDIVSPDTLDLAMKEAEVIKVMDEIIDIFPSLDVNKFSFRLNHTDLLRLILQFCRIDDSSHDAVAEVLSRLNVQWSWAKIRSELRGPLIGMSSTSVDELQQFDFIDSPQSAFRKLKELFQGSETFEKASPSIGHLSDVVMYLDRFQVKTKYFVSPLSSMNQRFYKGGVMFQCINETKKKDVFAAGGRYDSLIREHRRQTTGKSEGCHAVGFNFPWEKVSQSISALQQATGKAFLKKQENLTGIWITKRCDVLVACFDPSTLRDEGSQLVAKLWANDISAELAVDAKSPEDLHAKYAKDPHCWIVVVKQDSILKVKSLIRKEPDADIHAGQLVSYLRGEIRERDRHNQNDTSVRPQRHGSQAEPSNATHHDQVVRVLVGEAKSKKTNRHNIIEQAQEKAASLVDSFLDGPIAAIETTDRVLYMIRETSLSDPDSWRHVVQSVPMAERNYIKNVHQLLQDLATQNKSAARNAFVYNFRTTTCIYYDLGTDASSHPNAK